MPTEDESLTEADEVASLAEVPGVISPASAEVPRDVISTELDNEYGSIVHTVEVEDIDVKVDAGNGGVLDQQAGHGDEIGDDDGDDD